MKVLIISAALASQTLHTALVTAAFPEAEQDAYLDPLLAVKRNLTWDAEVVLCEFTLRIIDGIQLIKLLRKQNGGIVPILIDPTGGHKRDAKNLGISSVAAANALDYGKFGNRAFLQSKSGRIKRVEDRCWRGDRLALSSA